MTIVCSEIISRSNWTFLLHPSTVNNQSFQSWHIQQAKKRLCRFYSTNHLDSYKTTRLLNSAVLKPGRCVCESDRPLWYLFLLRISLSRSSDSLCWSHRRSLRDWCIVWICAGTARDTYGIQAMQNKSATPGRTERGWKAWSTLDKQFLNRSEQ